MQSNSKKGKENPVIQLMMITHLSVKMLDESEKLPKLPDDGKIEVFLFNALLTKRFLHISNSALFVEIQEDYNNLLVVYLTKIGLNNKVSGYLDFMNSRTKFFGDEIESMYLNENWLPSRLYSVFYENPLTDNIEPSFNPVKMIIFLTSLQSMIEFISRSVDIFVKTHDSLEN